MTREAIDIAALAAIDTLLGAPPTAEEQQRAYADEAATYLEYLAAMVRSGHVLDFDVNWDGRAGMMVSTTVRGYVDSIDVTVGYAPEVKP